MSLEFQGSLSNFRTELQTPIGRQAGHCCCIVLMENNEFNEITGVLLGHRRLEAKWIFIISFFCHCWGLWDCTNCPTGSPASLRPRYYSAVVIDLSLTLKQWSLEQVCFSILKRLSRSRLKQKLRLWRVLTFSNEKRAQQTGRLCMYYNKGISFIYLTHKCYTTQCGKNKKFSVLKCHSWHFKRWPISECVHEESEQFMRSNRTEGLFKHILGI